MAVKYNDKQIMALKQAGFSAEDIALFQHNPAYAPTPEELEAITSTKIIGDALKILPKDKKAFFNQIENTYGVLFEENLSEQEFQKRVELLAKQNPKLAEQVMTMILVSDYVEQN